MTFLRDFSIIWSLAHTLVLFLMLFESRYSFRKTLIISLSTMGPLIFINFMLSLIHLEAYGTLLLLTLSLPSMIVFWILSKYRDGRFFFTFCMVDTVVLEIIYVTQILNYYVSPGTNLFMFAVRLMIYPILEWLIYRKLRHKYRTLQKNIRRGWWTFAAIGVIFYLAISLMINQPTNITERPEYYPPLILMFLLMPVIYFHIFTTLFRQQQLHEMSEQEHILRLQVNHVTERVSELAEADEKFRIERHNFRHKMKAIASLVETEQYEELAMLVEEYNETLGKTQVTRYCRNAIIDAVLSSYIKRAESRGIRLTLGFAFPDPIPVNETELATAIANAIENAIHACEKLPEEKRFLEIKVISRPRFAIQIRNSFRGTVSFDEDGIPVNRAEDHGFGTRSIAAFCEKNNGYSIFKAENGVFTCYLNF